LAELDNVLIVDPTAAPAAINRAPVAPEAEPAVEVVEKASKKK